MWKSVLRSDRSTFQTVSENNGCRVLWAEEEKEHPDYQHKVQKKLDYGKKKGKTRL